MRCTKCSGQGRYLGNGFMMIDCKVCLGDGELPETRNQDHIYKDPAAKLEPIDKRSKLYKDSIKELMSVNPQMSRNDAEKLFDKAYEKG